jgi:hypothetical protein
VRKNKKKLKQFCALCVNNQGRRGEDDSLAKKSSLGRDLFSSESIFLVTSSLLRASAMLPVRYGSKGGTLWLPKKHLGLNVSMCPTTNLPVVREPNVMDILCRFWAENIYQVETLVRVSLLGDQLSL